MVHKPRACPFLFFRRAESEPKMKYNEVQWNTMKYNEVQWSTMKYNEV